MKQVILTISVLLNLGCLIAADKIVWIDGIEYAIFRSANSVSVIGCSADLTNAFIQDSVNYDEWNKYPVTTIGDNAFEGNNRLESVVIGHSVTTIYRKAFYNCEALKTIIISNNVKEIGNEAFALCSNLEQVNTPSSIESIADDAFFDCHKLPTYNNIRYADKFLVEAANKKTTPYSIQASTIIRPDTRWIGKEAFYGALFKNSTLVIPDSVEIIGESAFYNGDYESVILGESVKQIGKQAFVGRVSAGANGTPYLKTFRVKALTPPQIATKTISGVAGTFEDIFEFPVIPEIYVPCGTLETYLQSMWGKITAYGEQMVKYAPIPYSLTLEYDGHEGIVNQLNTPNECEPSITIEAIPNYGYEFEQWSDGSTDNPRVITLENDLTLTASFRLIDNKIGDIHIDATTPQKIIVNGQIFILRNNKTYTLQGQELK
ncbi:MAG: leucine-rich repeat protein [Paludibacteraceae bacterium]